MEAAGRAPEDKFLLKRDVFSSSIHVCFRCSSRRARGRGARSRVPRRRRACATINSSLRAAQSEISGPLADGVGLGSSSHSSRAGGDCRYAPRRWRAVLDCAATTGEALSVAAARLWLASSPPFPTGTGSPPWKASYIPSRLPGAVPTGHSLHQPPAMNTATHC